MKKRFFALLTAVCIALTTGLTTGLTALADGGENSDMTIGMSTQEQCSCTTLCTEGNINPDCPVCGAEGADLTACKGAPLMMRAAPLAAEEIKLFIGGQQITENGCYENRNGTWTKVDGTEPANGQFSYDAATFTLTLNEAEITNNQTVNVAEGYTYYGSVIAFSQTADVSLKIVVSQGTSTITGTGGIRVESTTGDVSLSIAGPGSLDVEPKGSSSGITLCSSKNMNLDIDGADVTASSPAQYGVYLISSTDASSTSTITVNNGSLTTGGNGHVGIYYYWSDTNNAGTSSLTVSGNAVVDTRNSRILTNNKETGVQVGAGSDGNGGIVFNGKSGTVYGDVELQKNLEIGEDETLTIPDGSSLNCNGNLTNNGTIINKGTLTGEAGGNGTVITAPTITTADTDLPDGTVGTEYKQTLTATGSNIRWSSNDLPAWLTLDSDGTISGTPTTANTYTFTVTAKNSAGSDDKTFTLTIGVAPVYSITAEPLKLDFGTLTEGYTPASQTVTIINNGNQELTLTQPASTEHFEVGNLSKTELAVGEEVTFTVQPKAGLAAGTYSEDITVSGTNATATIPASLTVQKASVPTKPEIPSTGTTSGGSTGESTYPDVEDAQTSYEQATRNFWNRTINKIKKADEGDSLRIYIGIHKEIPGDVIQAIRENGVNVTFYNQDGDEVTVYAESAPTKYQAVWTLKQLGNYVLTEQQTPAAQEESPADQQPADEPTTPTQPAETEAVDTAKPNPSTGEGSGTVIAMIAAAAALAGLGATLRKR